jgi:pyruvyl transferase EpsO
MQELRERLRRQVDAKLREVFPEEGRFALLDYPNHDNIGDSAIFVGEVDYVSHRKMVPSYISGLGSNSWFDLEKSIGEGPILLHGGGNLGDIWGDFQNFRESVLERYVGRPVLQFPQTIYFRSEDAADRFARIVERHGAFTLLVRDRPSYEFAKRKLQCDVHLCPDMAFAMRPLHRLAPQQDLLLHLRLDQEAAQDYATSELELPAKSIRRDWPEETGKEVEKWFRNALIKAAFSDLSSLQFDRKSIKWHRRAHVARYRVERGVKLLSTGKAVITDRLHGHILCCLLDIPHVALDNSYGKLSGFMEAWGTNTPRSRLASSLEEAVQIVRNDFL